MRALWIAGPGQLELRAVAPPAQGAEAFALAGRRGTLKVLVDVGNA